VGPHGSGVSALRDHSKRLQTPFALLEAARVAADECVVMEGTMSPPSIASLSGAPAQRHTSGAVPGRPFDVVDLAAYRASREARTSATDALRPRVRIYRPAADVNQAGRRRTRHWVLEFELVSRPIPDALMGWLGSSDTSQQVRLTFPTKAKAVAFAERQGWAYDAWEPGAGASPSISGGGSTLPVFSWRA